MNRRLVVLCLLAAPFAAHSQPADWQTVEGPNQSFRFEMPAPIEKTTADEKEKAHAGPRVAWEAKRDGQIFDFDFVDYEDGWFSKRNSKVMSKELGRGEAEKALSVALGGAPVSQDVLPHELVVRSSTTKLKRR